MKFKDNYIYRQFLRKNIWGIIGVMTLSAFSALGRIGGVSFVETITDTIQAGFPNGIWDFLMVVLIASAIMTSFYVTRVLVQVVAAKIGERMAVETRVRIVKHLAKIPFIKYEKYSTGELQSVYRNDIGIASGMVDTVFYALFGSAVLLVFQAVLMISLNPAAGIIVISFSVGLSVVNQFVAKLYKRFQAVERKAVGELTAVVEGVGQGMDTIKTYKARDYVMNSFLKIKRVYNKSTFNSQKVDSASNALYDLVSEGFFLGVVIYIGAAGINGYMTLGQILAFIAVYRDFTTPMRNILGCTRRYARESIAWKRVYELLEVPMQDNQSGETADNAYQSIDTLDIQNISFAYDENEDILHDFSISLKKGQSHVLIGESGCGKTTFLKIMTGLYDAPYGELLVDGRIADREKLFKSAVYVSSNNPLFTMSIYDNITLGDSRITREMCDALARELGIGDWLDSLPDGLDTEISENAKNISGGQQQTINNMRALLSGSAVIILDEPNSALDKDKETRLSKAIERMKHDKIILITSHRADMIAFCDAVFEF